MAKVVGFWAKNERLGPSDSQLEKNPVGFFIFGQQKQMLSFLGSDNTNLKLEIEPHGKQPSVSRTLFLRGWGGGW